jgi:hypothetical protein
VGTPAEELRSCAFVEGKHRLSLTIANLVKHDCSGPTREGAILAHAAFLFREFDGETEGRAAKAREDQTQDQPSASASGKPSGPQADQVFPHRYREYLPRRS